MDAKNGTVRKDIVALRELDVVALVKGFYYFILGSFFFVPGWAYHLVVSVGAGTEGRSAYGRGVWMQGSRPQIDKTLETLWLLTVFLILFGHGFAADVSGSARHRPGVRDKRRDCMSHVSMLDWRPTPIV